MVHIELASADIKTPASTLLFFTSPDKVMTFSRNFGNTNIWVTNFALASASAVIVLQWVGLVWLHTTLGGCKHM